MLIPQGGMLRKPVFVGCAASRMSAGEHAPAGRLFPMTMGRGCFTGQTFGSRDTRAERD
jgi:hypothetical protein